MHKLKLCFANSFAAIPMAPARPPAGCWRFQFPATGCDLHAVARLDGGVLRHVAPDSRGRRDAPGLFAEFLNWCGEPIHLRLSAVRFFVVVP